MELFKFYPLKAIAFTLSLGSGFRDLNAWIRKHFITQCRKVRLDQGRLWAGRIRKAFPDIAKFRNRVRAF